MERPRPAIDWPGSVSRKTASRSRGNSVTAVTRRSGRWTSRSSSTGLPVITFELKNNLTKQTVDDAVEQYRRDRNPREKLFELGRCVAHFALDESEARFCTHLKGKESWFLPFDRGWNDGAGNPPNPHGLKTDYLWREVLTRESLTDILENYAQIVEVRDEKTGRKRREQVWPRYHQLDAVRRLLADAAEHGAGRRYLVQHSAGSGKSNSIAWLAHQLIGLGRDGAAIFDSVIVVTDRRILDRQINDTIRQYAQIGATVGMPTAPATCAGSSSRARRSSSRRYRNSPSSSTRSVTSSAVGASPSSSTRPTPARAAAPAPQWRRHSPRPAWRERTRRSRTGSTG